MAQIKKMRSGVLTTTQLAFISGLIHDIGKLSFEFIKSKEPQTTFTDFHGQILWQDKEKIPKKLWYFLNDPWPEHPEVTIARLACSHHGCQRCLGPDGCEGLEDHPIKKLLQTYDRCDTSNPADSGKQNACNMEMESFFGIKKKIDPLTFDAIRFNLYQKLDEALGSSKTPHQLILEWTTLILGATINAFCETRKFATDLTLGAHLLSTAILFSLGVGGKHILCTSIPVSEKFTNGFSIGEDGYERAILTTERNMLPDEIIHDRFIPFNEFIWLVDALPDHEPSLESILEKCRTSWVKQPEDIEPGYTFDKLTFDLDKLKDLAKLSYAQDLEEKRRSWGRHLKNLKKAEMLGKLDSEWTQHLKILESRLEEIEQVLSQIGSVSELLAKNGWGDCPEAYEWAWFFLSKTMSPIRPTSPVTWARRILEEDPCDSNESAVKWVLGRRLTLGRWLAIKLEQAQRDGTIADFVRECLQTS